MTDLNHDVNSFALRAAEGCKVKKTMALAPPIEVALADGATVATSPWLRAPDDPATTVV